MVHKRCSQAAVLTGLLALVLLMVAVGARPAGSAAAAASPAEVMIIYADSDATTRSWLPDASFGSESTLELSYSAAPQAAYTLLHFDVSAIPTAAIIDSAFLELYQYASSGAGSVWIGVYDVYQWWSESVTWNTRPNAQTGGFVLGQTVDAAAGYKSWSVSGFVDYWRGHANYGVELRGPILGDTPAYGRFFHSREGANKPRLVITYRLPTPTPTPTPLRFEGRVFEGDVADESSPLSGVTVSLYAGNSPYPSSGTLLRTATTNAWGGYSLPLQHHEAGYEFYHIRQTNLPGYDSVGATTSGGIVRTADWIEYVIPLAGKTLSGDRFWDRRPPTATPTHTPTPTRTPTYTRTPSPTRTPSITPTRTPSHTPTRTPTFTPTRTPSPTGAPTSTPSHTPTRTPSFTPTRTPSVTPSLPTQTLTFTPSATAKPVTATPTPTPTLPPLVSFDLCAVADSTITDSSPGANYGDDPILRVGFGAGENEPFSFRSLVRFDLSFIPPFSQIESARFEAGLVVASGVGVINVSLYEVRADWEEMGVTWANQPPVTAAAIVRTPVDSSTPTIVSWEVTELVQAWMDGALDNKGIMMRGQEGGAQWQRVFDSRHHTPFCPRLVLAVRPNGVMPTPTPTPLPTPTATATSTCPHVDLAGNTFESATPLTPDGLLYQEYICPSGDPDWWRFPADHGQEIVVSLGNMPQAPPADYDLFLISPSGGLVASSERWGADKDEYINVTVWQSGEYRVLVKGKGVADWSKTQQYHLRVTTTYVCFEPDETPGDFFAAAKIETSLPQAGIVRKHTGAICPAGDNDIYKFTVPGGQIVTIRARLTDLPADYNLFLYSPDSQVLGSSLNAGLADEEIVYVANNMPGDWRVHIQGATYNSYHGQPYTLEVALSGNADLTVQGIEVTQAIQGLNNPVSLVIGKPAVARVYIGGGGAPGPVSNVTVRLRAWRLEYGWPVPLAETVTLGPAAFSSAPLDNAKRLAYTSSANFPLPASWMTGHALRLEAEVNPGPTVPETNYSNNKLQTGNIAVATTRTIHVGLVPVRAAGLAPVVQNNPIITEMISYLRSVYPATQIQFWVMSGGPLDADYNYLMPATGCGAGWDALLDDLEDVHDSWSGRPDNAFVYGLIDPGVPPGPGHGCGRTPGVAAAGMLGGDSGILIAHEMGHNFGRLHAPDCVSASLDPKYPTYVNPQGTPYPGGSIGEVGVRVGSGQTFDPANVTDLMGYCGVWISPHNYTGILQQMPKGAAASAGGADVPHLVVSGRAQDGQVELPRPFWQQMLPAGSHDQPGEGPYSIRLLSAGGDVLFERRFEPPAASASDHDFGYFREILPLPEALVARIAFLFDGRVIHEIRRSQHAPTVRVLTPNGGESWTTAAPQTIRWQASDEDGDLLTARVLYSHDGGASWQPLAVNQRGSEFEVNAGDLAGGQTSLIQVQVSDGVNVGSDRSDRPFSVSDKPPLVWILAPADGLLLPPGQPIFLQAAASDPEDGPLDGERLAWSSSIDGPLGQGSLLALTGLSSGRHEITVTATDSQGQSSHSSVHIILGRPYYLPLILAASQRAVK